MLLFQLWRYLSWRSLCLVRPSSVLLLLRKRGFCWALGVTALHPICRLCRLFLPPSHGTFKASLRTLTSEDFKMTSARLRLPTGTCRGSCEHLNGIWSLWRSASFCKGVSDFYGIELQFQPFPSYKVLVPNLFQQKTAGVHHLSRHFESKFRWLGNLSQVRGCLMHRLVVKSIINRDQNMMSL